MKHIFVVETADDVYLPFDSIDSITRVVEGLIESHINGRMASCQSVCNVRSAIRAVYGLYSADTSKGPDELGSAK